MYDAHAYYADPPLLKSGYSATEVKALLARVGAGQQGGEGQMKLKRVVMLSSVGVNRRDDLMLKLRQMHTNLDERVSALFFHQCPSWCM